MLTETTWVVELTINGSIRPIQVKASSAERAKDAACEVHPEAERCWNAYTLRQWQRIIRMSSNP